MQIDLCSSTGLQWLHQPLLLDTVDASNTSVLSQADEQGREHVIAYASCTLSKAERHYCVTRKELLAVITFIHHFRPYLISRKFTLHWLSEVSGSHSGCIPRLLSADSQRNCTAHGLDHIDPISKRQCQVVHFDRLKRFREHQQNTSQSSNRDRSPSPGPNKTIIETAVWWTVDHRQARPDRTSIAPPVAACSFCHSTRPNASVDQLNWSQLPSFLQGREWCNTANRTVCDVCKRTLYLYMSYCDLVC